MQELWSEFEDKPVVRLLVEEDIKELFDTSEYNYEQGKWIFTNPNFLPEQFMKKYGIKVGKQYFIELGRFIEIIRKTGELLPKEK